MYQRAMDEIMRGIHHAYAIMNVILIAGRNIAHHYSVLKTVLQVQYVGPIILAEGLKPDPEKVRAMNDMPHS